MIFSCKYNTSKILKRKKVYAKQTHYKRRDSHKKKLQLGSMGRGTSFTFCKFLSLQIASFNGQGHQFRRGLDTMEGRVVSQVFISLQIASFILQKIELCWLYKILQAYLFQTNRKIRTHHIKIWELRKFSFRRIDVFSNVLYQQKLQLRNDVYRNYKRNN